MEDIERRIILLGKTGAGKSSLANTIFGVKDLFKVSHGSNSQTNVCESRTENVNGRNIQLIDTPGLFDTDPRSQELSPELLKCITECAPGPHAFLIVLKVERYTRQEQAVVDIIFKYFSEEALKYTTVVFTHGEQLEEGMKIEEWVSKNEELSTLIQKCGGRSHVFDNKKWNNSQHPYRNNQHQVRELLSSIDRNVAKNGGIYYTNEFLQSIGDKLQQEVKCLQVCRPGITFKDILQRAKEVVFKKLWDNMEGALVGLILGALLGARAGVMAAIAISPGWIMYVSGAVTGVTIGAPTGALVGAWGWKTPTEAVQDVTKFLKEIEPLALQANQTWTALKPLVPSATSK